MYEDSKQLGTETDPFLTDTPPLRNPGENVHVWLEHTSIHYTEDGRPCQLVRLRDLQHGDEILGWHGEPWTFGKFDHLEKYPVQSYGPAGVQYRYVMHMQEEPRTSSPLVTDESWRRIARRGQQEEG